METPNVVGDIPDSGSIIHYDVEDYNLSNSTRNADTSKSVNELNKRNDIKSNQYESVFFPNVKSDEVKLESSKTMIELNQYNLLSEMEKIDTPVYFPVKSKSFSPNNTQNSSEFEDDKLFESMSKCKRDLLIRIKAHKAVQETPKEEMQECSPKKEIHKYNQVVTKFASIKNFENDYQKAVESQEKHIVEEIKKPERSLYKKSNSSTMSASNYTSRSNMFSPQTSKKADQLTVSSVVRRKTESINNIDKTPKNTYKKKLIATPKDSVTNKSSSLHTPYTSKKATTVNSKSTDRCTVDSKVNTIKKNSSQNSINASPIYQKKKVDIIINENIEKKLENKVQQKVIEKKIVAQKIENIPKKTKIEPKVLKPQKLRTPIRNFNTSVHDKKKKEEPKTISKKTKYLDTRKEPIEEKVTIEPPIINSRTFKLENYIEKKELNEIKNEIIESNTNLNDIVSKCKENEAKRVLQWNHLFKQTLSKDIITYMNDNNIINVDLNDVDKKNELVDICKQGNELLIQKQMESIKELKELFNINNTIQLEQHPFIVELKRLAKLNSDMKKSNNLQLPLFDKDNSPSLPSLIDIPSIKTTPANSNTNQYKIRKSKKCTSCHFARSIKKLFRLFVSGK